jgi:hypothetical protein
MRLTSERRLPGLSPRSKSWLLRALNESAPKHPWITHLRTEGPSNELVPN